MRTVTSVIIFVVYFIAVVLFYLSSKGWIISEFSSVQYVTDSLGISTGNWITLCVYCLWTFGVMEYTIGTHQLSALLVRLFFLILNIFAVPLSIVLFILYNNTRSTGFTTTADVLSIFFLLIVSGGLNTGFMLILKMWEKLMGDKVNG